MTRKEKVIVDVEQLADRILTIRGQKVILDSELAALYGVTTGRFNEAVERNLRRFPHDFMFRLSAAEQRILGSQAAVAKSQHGGRRYAPRVFTEHGAIMAAGILNSQTAIEVSMYVVRAFVAMRVTFAGHREIGQRLNELEARLEKKLASHDQAIAEILSAIRGLMNSPPATKRPIGFITPRP